MVDQPTNEYTVYILESHPNFKAYGHHTCFLEGTSEDEVFDQYQSLYADIPLERDHVSIREF